MRKLPVRGIYLWLALLTLLTVFASLAGAREALASRTDAVRQTIGANSPLSRTIIVTSTWNSVQGALTSPISPNQPVVTPGVLTDLQDQLNTNFNRGVVKLEPTSSDMWMMATPLYLLPTTFPGTGGTPVKIEINERQPFSDKQMRLVSGTFPVATPAPGQSSGDGTPASQLRQSAKLPTIQVVISTQTAARFGLKVGSKFEMPGPERATTGETSKVEIVVTGVVAPIDPNSTFWTADPSVLAPDLQGPATGPYWAGTVMVAPGETQELEEYFSSTSMTVEWVFPLSVSTLTGQQVQPLESALDLLSTQVPTLTGYLTPVAPALTTSSSMLYALQDFIQTAEQVDTLLWLLYVSLAVTGLAVLLLAGRMIAMRRTGELSVIRARGASLRQIALSTAGGAALLCVPAAVLGVLLALAAVPSAGSVEDGGAGGLWPAVAVLLVAVCGPALIAAWQHRLPRRDPGDRRQIRARRRLIIEVMLIAAAVAGLVVFRNQGNQAGAGVNLYTSTAPVLVAIPVVIVILRIYPLVLRGLVRLSVRTRRAPGFIGLARASRTALTPALPAFALVLALTVAAFAGMVRDAVANGEVAASWQSAGADAMVTPSSNLYIPAPTIRAMADVPGVAHSATVWNALWQTQEGAQLNVIAVDPASYAALVASSPGYPQVQTGLLKVPGTAGAAQPVLASPAAAAELGHAPIQIGTYQGTVAPVRVQVAGIVASTPAFTGTGSNSAGAFVIMPIAAIRSTATPPQQLTYNEMLLNGGSIDHARLSSIVAHQLFGGSVSYRSDVLAALSNGPLQHGAFTLFTLAIGAAAALGLAVMLLELALGAAERDSTLARLSVMGLGERQRTWVVALEVLPAVIAAAVAAWACAVALPQALAPDVNLSVFTSSSVPVPLVANVAAVAVPLIGLALVAVVALVIEIRWGRRRGAASLRVGE